MNRQNNDWRRISILAALFVALPVLTHAGQLGGMDHAITSSRSNTVSVGTTTMTLEIVNAEPGQVGQIVIRLTDRHDGTPISGATVSVQMTQVSGANMDSTHHMEMTDMGTDASGASALERAEQGVYVYEHLFPQSRGVYRITARVSAIKGHALDAPFSVSMTQDVVKKGGMGMMNHGMHGGILGGVVIGAAMIGMMVLQVIY